MDAINRVRTQRKESIACVRRDAINRVRTNLHAVFPTIKEHQPHHVL